MSDEFIYTDDPTDCYYDLALKHRAVRNSRRDALLIKGLYCKKCSYQMIGIYNLHGYAHWRCCSNENCENHAGEGAMKMMIDGRIVIDKMRPT